MSFASRFAPRRTSAALACICAALILAACGGGEGEVAVSPVGFNVDVTVGGQVLVNDQLVAPGGSLDVVLQADQSVTVDAGEPVVWSLVVGGNEIPIDNTDVHYAGVDIAATILSSSTIALDIFADFLLPASVSVTLIATSTFDSAQVATINLLITN